MEYIADWMRHLYDKGVLPRDLKAANILIDLMNMAIVDFECSSGVFWTQFWRRPQILLALKNRDVIEFLEEADV